MISPQQFPEGTHKPGDKLTLILDACRQGEQGATDRLFSMVYHELRRMAHRHMLREKRGATMQTTVLVNEAYLRLVDKDGRSNWENRRHFFGAAAQAMRRILVDRARRSNAAKRGGDSLHQVVTEQTPAPADSPVDHLALDEALTSLELAHPRAAKAFALRYFLGMTYEQVAELLGVSKGTVTKDFTFAKAWLNRCLAAGASE